MKRDVDPQKPSAALVPHGDMLMQDNYLKFQLWSLCDPGLFFAGSSWQKRAGFGIGRGAGQGMCCGDRLQQVPPLPATCNHSPCQLIGAGGTPQLAQSHCNRTSQSTFQPLLHPITHAIGGAGSETSVINSGYGFNSSIRAIRE